MAGNEISVLSLSARSSAMERDVKEATRFFLKVLDKNNVGLEIFLVDEKKMSAINKQYRGKNSPTNVLAFEPPMEFPHSGDNIARLGEIYLSPTYIKKHEEDLFYMLLHGILHLVGFNHENKSDRISMEKIEGGIIRRWHNSKS